jgi:hypothetical protein
MLTGMLAFLGRAIREAREEALFLLMLDAQPTMAQWVADNPNWTITRWSCEYAQRRRTKV